MKGGLSRHPMPLYWHYWYTGPSRPRRLCCHSPSGDQRARVLYSLPVGYHSVDRLNGSISSRPVFDSSLAQALSGEVSGFLAVLRLTRNDCTSPRRWYLRLVINSGWLGVSTPILITESNRWKKCIYWTTNRLRRNLWQNHLEHRQVLPSW